MKIVLWSFRQAGAAICRTHNPNYQNEFINHANNPVGGGISKRRPDMVMVNRRPGDTAASVDWCDALVIGEFKVLASLNKTVLQLASYVREVFGAQPNRRFVLGFTLCGHDMRIWQFDRAGAIGSKAIHILNQLEMFIRVVIGFCTMDSASLQLLYLISRRKVDSAISTSIVAIKKKHFVLGGRSSSDAWLSVMVLSVGKHTNQAILLKKGTPLKTRSNQEYDILRELCWKILWTCYRRTPLSPSIIIIRKSKPSMTTDTTHSV